MLRVQWMEDSSTSAARRRPEMSDGPRWPEENVACAEFQSGVAIGDKVQHWREISRWGVMQTAVDQRRDFEFES